MYEHWFKSSVVFADEFTDRFSIGYQIQKDTDPDVPIGTQVAIMGFDPEIADAIRREFYQCSYNFNQLQLIDFGNIRKKEMEFTVQILTEIKKAGLNLVVLGPDDTFLAATQRISDPGQQIAFIEKAGNLLFQPQCLNTYLENDGIKKVKLLAYQSHLFHMSLLSAKKLNQSLGLGDIRNNMRDAEPVLRDVDSLHFMLDSIRYSELPGIPNTTPSGLTSEEACQLLRYFGLNPIRNCLAVYGYDPKYDFHNQGVKMVSQLIWYYLEGLDQKKMDKPESRESMAEFVVELSDYNLSLSFWKSDYSGRWWVEVPVSEGEPLFLPCSYLDYKLACNNEMPRRIMTELD
jgi:hypothetical protein